MKLPKHLFPIQWQILQTNWRRSSPIPTLLADIRMNHVIAQALTKINKSIVLWRYVNDIFVAFNDMSALDIFFNTLNSVHNDITFTKELECGDSLAFLDVLIEKTQCLIQTTTYRKPTHSGLYTHWTSFIPHHQKRNLLFGLLDRAYKIASTYNAIHSEFINIKSMLIRNGYPQGRNQTFSFGVATGGASFATRGAVNGLCRIFRKRPEKFWVSTWGQAKFCGGSAPPGTPLAPPLGIPKHTLIAASWNISTRNMKPPLIRSR